MTMLSRAQRQQTIREALARIERGPFHLDWHQLSAMVPRSLGQTPPCDFKVRHGMRRRDIWRRTTIADWLRAKVQT